MSMLWSQLVSAVPSGLNSRFWGFLKIIFWAFGAFMTVQLKREIEYGRGRGEDMQHRGGNEPLATAQPLYRALEV